jgi:hypothetical protein
MIYFTFTERVLSAKNDRILAGKIYSSTEVKGSSRRDMINIKTMTRCQVILP